MRSLIGTLIAIVDGVGMACKLARAEDGTLDLVTLGGGVSVGTFGTARVLSVLKSGAAQRRLIEAGVLKYGRQSYIPAAWLASAHASVVDLPTFFEHRLAWITDDKQRDQHVALLAEIRQIIAQEEQAA